MQQTLLNVHLLYKTAAVLKTDFCHTSVNMNCNLWFPERQTRTVLFIVSNKINCAYPKNVGKNCCVVCFDMAA